MSMKNKVREILARGDRQALIAMAIEDKKAATAVSRLLFDGDELIRWRAVKALGWLAAEDQWLLQKTVPRLVYTMNDDAGQVGWMSAQALGEICAVEPDLVEDFLPNVFCQIELPVFTVGILWAMGRVAESRPDLVSCACRDIRPYLADENPTVRGTAAWAAGTNGCREVADDLKLLADDRAELSWYENDKMVRKTVADLAGRALAALGG